MCCTGYAGDGGTGGGGDGLLLGFLFGRGTVLSLTSLVNSVKKGIFKSRDWDCSNSTSSTLNRLYSASERRPWSFFRSSTFLAMRLAIGLTAGLGIGLTAGLGLGIKSAANCLNAGDSPEAGSADGSPMSARTAGGLGAGSGFAAGIRCIPYAAAAAEARLRTIPKGLAGGFGAGAGTPSYRGFAAARIRHVNFAPFFKFFVLRPHARRGSFASRSVVGKCCLVRLKPLELLIV